MRFLKPAKRSLTIEQIRKKLFVFDVETTKLEPMPKNFVFGVIYGYNFSKVIKSVSDFKKEFNKKKYDNCFIFAHNAEFDLTAIFGNIYKNLDSSAVFNGKFISAKHNKITFGDSLNIYPTKLANIGKLMNLEKIENKKVSTNKLTKNNISESDINYCLRDCEIVYKALEQIFESTGTIKLTISSLSMYEYRKKYLPKILHFSELVDEFYNSYYGGRTEAFKIGDVKAKVYDINSLYPYAMLNVVLPDISNLKISTNCDNKFLIYCINFYEGLAEVELEHLEHYFGFVPFKDEKLLFPIGTFKTTLNFNELRFALKHKIIKIKKIYKIVYGNRIESPFKNFISDNYQKRLNSDNELSKLIYKLLMNSNYGKWAQRIKFTDTYYDLIPYHIIEELEKTESYYELKLFNKLRNDCFLTTENEKYKNSFFSIPTYSSYITSYSRIKLLDSLLNNINNIPVYCDTDSIFLEGEFIGDVGKNIGQFKKENKQVVNIRGLKHYSYIDTNFKFDKNFSYYYLCNYLKPIEMIKGVSKGSERIGKDSFKKVQYYKTLESLRHNKETGSKKEVIKNVTGKYDKRIILPNGNTKPIKL